MNWFRWLDLQAVLQRKSPSQLGFELGTVWGIVLGSIMCVAIYFLVPFLTNTIRKAIHGGPQQSDSDR